MEDRDVQDTHQPPSSSYTDKLTHYHQHQHDHRDDIYSHDDNVVKTRQQQQQQQQQEQPQSNYNTSSSSSSSSYSSSDDQAKEILDNIIVGYAFGRKKMKTMENIMKEASKALSTFECGVGVLPPTLMKKQQQQQQQQQQHQRCAINNNHNHHHHPTTTTSTTTNSDVLEVMEDSSTTTSAASTLTTNNHYYYHNGGFDDEEDIRSLSSSPSQRGGSGGGNHGGNSNMRGIQLTFMPDSNGYIHLINSNSSSSSGGGGGGGSSFGGGESVTDFSSSSAATTSTITTDGTTSTTAAAATFLGRKHQQQHHHQQQQQPQHHFGAVDKMDWSESSSSSSSSSDPSRKYKNTVVQRHPIRVSFLPIDLEKPLEEQHGGKFDVILHKMTEDILCMSKMLRLHEVVMGGGEMHHQNLIHNKGVKPLDLITPTDTMTLDQARASRRIQRLREYKKKVHPACVLVDSPSNILAVMSRADMAEVLSRCLAGVTTKAGIPVRTPRFKVVDEDKNLESRDGCDILANEIDNAGFEYPLIAKPLTAAGTKKSHHMGIVLARDGLQRLDTPCLLQEYANHGETLFKVYVLGNSVWVFSRESTPNLPLGEKEIITVSNDNKKRPKSSSHENDSYNRENNRLTSFSRKRQGRESYVEFERQPGSRCYVEFNSQHPYPKRSDFGNLHDAPRNKQQRCSSLQNPHHNQEQETVPIGHDNDLARFVTREEIEPVTNALRSAFGLDLFGFDVLVKEGGNDREILVVDVNYFPGYKEVQNFPSLLAQYLTTKAVESRWTNAV